MSGVDRIAHWGQTRLQIAFEADARAAAGVGPRDVPDPRAHALLLLLRAAALAAGGPRGAARPRLSAQQDAHPALTRRRRASAVAAAAAGMGGGRLGLRRAIAPPPTPSPLILNNVHPVMSDYSCRHARPHPPPRRTRPRKEALRFPSPTRGDSSPMSMKTCFQMESHSVQDKAANALLIPGRGPYFAYTYIQLKRLALIVGG